MPVSSPHGNSPRVSASFGLDDARLLRLVISGECDLAAADHLNLVLAEIDQLPARPGRIDVDLSGVSFIDTAGLSTVERHLSRLQADGWDLSVTAWSNVVSRIANLVGSPLAQLAR